MLAFALAALALTSCQKTTTEEVTTVTSSAALTSVTSATTEADEGTALDIVRAGKSDYKIYYPEDAGADIVNAAKRLATALKDYSGARISYTGDFLPRGTEPDETAHEILIGNTNRPESAGYDFLENEYICTISGNKLVINGYDGESCNAAVTKLINNIIKRSETMSYGKTDGDFTFTIRDAFENKVSRPVEKIRLCGEDIQNVSIVTPEGDTAARYIATMLADHIRKISGITVPIITDKTTPSGAEIRIGKTARTETTVREGEYKIVVTEKALEVVSDSPLYYAEAYEELESRIFSSKSKEITLSAALLAEGSYAPIPENNGIRVMYHNVWGYVLKEGGETKNPVSVRDDIAAIIYAQYKPSVLCLEEAGEFYRDNADVLFRWLSEHSYAEVTHTDSDSKGNPIFYNKKQLTLLEKGYLKSRNGDKGTSYAVFADKATQKSFAVINSHFAANSNADGDSTKGNQYRVADAECVLIAIAVITEKYADIPILCGGDYNSTLSAEPCQKLQNAGLQPARDLADTATGYGTYIGTGGFRYNTVKDYFYLNSFSYPSAAGAIDHILLGGAADKVRVVRYDIVSTPLACTASDHVAHYTDILWK